MPVRAEVTVFLSMVFILMVTFTGAVVESASIQAAKNYRRADVNRAMESVFAEYQKDLWQQYGLFALEGSYESGSYSEDLLKDRLGYYGASNMEHETTRIQFLTDNGAEVFYQQVMAYMQHLYGAEFLTDLLGETDTWKDLTENQKDYEAEDDEVNQELNDLLEENEAELPEENNPIGHISDLKKSPILSLVMPKDQEISDKTLELSGTVSHRKLNQGYGDFSDQEEGTMNLSSILFGQYVLDRFSSATDHTKAPAGDGTEEKKGEALDYEIEYLIIGKGSDKENLKSVVNRLLLMRLGLNMAYLETCPAKRDTVRELCDSLCALVPVPLVGELVAQAVLLAWGYGEALVDLRSLLKGNRVPLTKSDQTWQLSLSSLSKLGEDGDQNDGADAEGGLSYENYLRILLFMTGREKLALRTLDLIEINMQNVQGLSFFKADQCITKWEVSSTCNLRRGITYQFPTYFAYQ